MASPHSYQRQARRSAKDLAVESLESRHLLAGDLVIASQLCTAALDAGDDARPAYVAGDANKDGTYDPADVQSVVDAAKYQSGQPANWSEGDWNGDEAFDQHDLVSAVDGWPSVIKIPAGFESEGSSVGVVTSSFWEAQLGLVI